MATLRRLVSFCLVLAFAGYGMVAAAPAHAHGQSGLVIAAVHVVTGDDADLHLAAHDHHDGDHADDASHADDATSHDTGGELGHGGFHVHAAAVFTQADEPQSLSQPARLAAVIWAQVSSKVVAGLASPPIKPPRSFL